MLTKRSMILVVAMLFGATGAAASTETAKDGKIEVLEQRVAELEAQNRSILALLRELKEDLAIGKAVPATAGAPAEARVGEAGPTASGRALPAVLKSAAPQSSGSSQKPRQNAEPSLPQQIQVGKSRLGFYGFVRVDAIYDSSRASHPQFPSFILSEDSSVSSGNGDSFNFHPRLTRFGMNFLGPTVAGLSDATLSAKIEIDFQNGGKESRQVIRLRHGYLKLGWQRWSMLAGQTWDAFSPLYPTVNGDSLMWNAGNLGDRRPQIRFAYDSHRKAAGLSFVVGIGLTGAIDAQDLDGNGVRDGDDASLPNFQTRIGGAGPLGSDGRWSFGFSGHYGREETDQTFAGENQFDSHSLNLDLDLAFNDRVTLKGEVWSGRNLSDFRGGIGQGINRATGQEIDSEGGWLELGLQLSETYSLYGGYTIDDPTDGDVPAGGRTQNYVWYLVQRFRFGQSFTIGIEYLNWTTEFKGLDDGTDDRFNLYLIYSF